MNHYVFGCNVQFDEPTLDKLFQDCFGYKTDGVFVEVGGHDGASWSHTYAIAHMGWRGVYVEPVPALAALCRKNHANHPGVTVRQCAAGRSNGTCVIHVDENSVCGSTMNLTICKQPKPLQVAMLTLDRILEEEMILRGFDLLSIDVEFAEMEVLAGFTLERWLPKMVIIELCEKHGGEKQEWAKPAREYCEGVFPAHGYRKVYAEAINTVFVRP